MKTKTNSTTFFSSSTLFRVVVLYFALLALPAEAQKPKLSRLEYYNLRQAQMERFIPKDYIMIDSLSGYFNDDPYSDFILVVQYEGKNPEQDHVDLDHDRKLMVLMGLPDNEVELTLTSDEVVMCTTCGGVLGDPYWGMKVENNALVFYLLGGANERWGMDVSFVYDNTMQEWVFYSMRSFSYWADNPNTLQEKMYTQAERKPLRLVDFRYATFWEE